MLYSEKQITSSWLSALAVAVTVLFYPLAYAAPSTPAAPTPAAPTAPTLSAEELEAGIARVRTRVPEFDFIQKEAAKLKVRAWLFGGTAASFAHYVKQDQLRAKGDTRFQESRYDYDFTNIFRSTQDMDIVVDGTPAQAEILQKLIQEKFPYLQGSKTQWEVRLLRKTTGDKESLLGNPDFLNQHTDSHSTGMVELTSTPNEHPVRDLRDWDAKKAPQFLRDVAEGKLHYYWSETHGQTNRARQGLNPPILSAIRYLIKAFQFELTLEPEDLKRIQRVISEFNPKTDLQKPYVTHWLEKNAPKLYLQSSNVEYSATLLDQLGLRKKLTGIGNPEETHTMAWWLNREPLRSSPVGQGSGRTFAEVAKDSKLKELTVAHETSDFLAYESITRSATGQPNVLISRKGINGEGAIHGNGFYTAQGRQGAKATGLTIRFRVDPAARVGHDFQLVPAGSKTITEGSYIIWKNRNALQVIPETANWSPVQYFQYLAAGEGFSKDDLAILEKLRRRVSNQFRNITPELRQEILTSVRSTISSRGNNAVLVAKEWMKLTNSPAEIEDVFVDFVLQEWDKKGKLKEHDGVKLIVSLKEELNLPKEFGTKVFLKWCETQFDKPVPFDGYSPDVLWLSDLMPSKQDNEKLTPVLAAFQRWLDRGQIHKLTKNQISDLYLHLELIQRAPAQWRKESAEGLVRWIQAELGRPWAKEILNAAPETFKGGGDPRNRLKNLLNILGLVASEPAAEKLINLIETRTKKNPHLRFWLNSHVYSGPRLRESIENEIRSTTDLKKLNMIVRFTLTRPETAEMEDLVLEVAKRMGSNLSKIADDLLPRTHGLRFKNVIRYCVEHGDQQTLWQLAHIFKKLSPQEVEDALLVQAIKRSDSDTAREYLKIVFERPGVDYPKAREVMLARAGHGNNYEHLITQAFGRDLLRTERPKEVKLFLKHISDEVVPQVCEFIMKDPKLAADPELLVQLTMKATSYESIAAIKKHVLPVTREHGAPGLAEKLERALYSPYQADEIILGKKSGCLRSALREL